jgi:multiple sugar transport system permease protein
MSRRGTHPLGIAWLWLVCLFASFPIVYMAVTSLKTRAMLYEPARLLFTPTLDNYRESIVKYGLGRYVIDSLVVSLANVALCVVLGTLAAYALHRFTFRYKRALVLSILSARILPSIALVIPFYIIGSVFRLLDTYALLIAVFTVFNLPFVIVMMKSFFANVPPDQEEAAMLDGCSRVQAVARVVLPQVGTGLFATAIMSFIAAWNEFTYALFLTSSNVKLISTAVVFFKTERGVLWGEVSALGVVAMLPVLVLCFATQKYLVRGMS